MSRSNRKEKTVSFNSKLNTQSTDQSDFYGHSLTLNTQTGTQMSMDSGTRSDSTWRQGYSNHNLYWSRGDYHEPDRFYRIRYGTKL